MSHLYGKFTLVSFILAIGFGGLFFLNYSGFFDKVRYGNGTISITIQGTKFKETSLHTTIKRGEKVVIVIRNRDEGRNHNFSIKALGLETTVLQPEEMGIIEFSPATSGKYNFLCTLHATKMTGILEVTVQN